MLTYHWCVRCSTIDVMDLDWIGPDSSNSDSELSGDVTVSRTESALEIDVNLSPAAPFQMVRWH